MTIEELKELFLDKYWYRPFSKSTNPKIVKIKSYIIELTNFLEDNAKMTTRAWHISNNFYEYPKCNECGKVIKKWNKETSSYNKFCSSKCAGKSNDTKLARENTNLQKFGVKHSGQSSTVKENIKKTNIDRYGVASTLELSHIKEKIKETNKEKYGTENVFSSDIIKDKIKETHIEKYGVDNPMKNDSIKEKALNSSIEKYGEYHLKNKKIKEKIKSTNMERYGSTHYMQSHIPIDSYEKMNNEEWLRIQHYNNKRTIEDIANELGIGDTTLNTYFKKHGILAERFFSSMPEKYIANILSANNIKYISNDRNAIFPYELDIYLPERKLAVEFCGLYWHSDQFKSSNYHRLKYELCKDKNIRLITIFENEWLSNSDKIKHKILHICNSINYNKIYARKTSIVEVDTKTKTKFFDDNHIQENGPSSINYGLEYNGELVACIGFIKNNDGSYNLNRYATSHNVIGGFTKLLSHFEKLYNNPKIITFADLRWSQGDLYYNTGFTMDKELKPDYYWTKSKMLYHKFGFRHSGMKSKLENYDPNLSENDNMRNHGYYKIWDCGKLRFTKN